MSKLYEDALKLSINENLHNIRTLLDWAEEAGDIEEAAQHAEQALRLLSEVVRNIEELRG